MATEVKYIPMRGGLDLVSSPLAMDEGRIIEGTNFEQIFGKNGYRRIDGYERYDGRPTPSETLYYTLPLVSGPGAIAVNDIITGASASAEVALVYPDHLIIFNLTGNWTANEDIQVTAVTQAQAAAAAAVGTLADANHLNSLKIAQDRQRDNIGKPPGSGAILGLHVFKGVCYCVRNAADGNSATLYKATGAGWVAVRTGLQPSGRWRFTTSNFTGDSANLAFYGCDGKNTPIKYDGVRCINIGAASVASSVTSNTPAAADKTFTLAETGRDFVAGQAIYVWSAANPADYMAGKVKSYSGNTLVVTVSAFAGATARTDWRFSHVASGQIYGSQAASGTSLAIATGAQTFVVLETLRGWSIGDDLTVWSNANATNRMRGTVTSYSGTSLVLNVTEVAGSGTFSDWVIGKTAYTDKPFELIAHRSHLFFCYPQGQLQHSNLGDPLTYTSTAGSFGLGDDLTGLAVIKGGALAVVCRSRTDILYGSSTTTWRLETHSMDAGAILGTLVEIAGAALMVDDRGLVSLQSTQNYGDFESANISKPIKPLIDKKLLNIIGAKSHKGKNLCRIYFDDGTGVNATMFEPSALIDPKFVAFTRFQYNHIPNCVCRGEKSDGTEVHYFGTTDGWVMREDSGWNFDGAPIVSAFRLPFVNLKSPSNKKRFRKLTIEADVGRSTTINFRQLMDYGDGNYAAGQVAGGDFVTGGGVFDSAQWDTILWSAPLVGQAEANIDGVGRNMSLLLWHEDDFMPSFTVQGLILHYSILGLAR